MKHLFKKPIFWISFIAMSMLCFWYAFTFFPTAFPIVNIDITIDRDEAIKRASTITKEFNAGPHAPSVAVTFDSDSQTQTFVELAGGGQQAFLDMLDKHYYMPYTWHVRYFKEYETNEAHIYLTPQGTLYGIREKISENDELPSLSRDDALKIVVDNLQKNFMIDTNVYTLIEDAKNALPNGRIDRTFVFERSDADLVDGRYRIKTKIRGNKLTYVKQLVKIPQDFTLAYKEMRATNNTIAHAAHIFSFLVYLLMGSLFGIFVLMRCKWVLWQPAVTWALLIAGLLFLDAINKMPLMWMYYKTETGKLGFLLHLLINALSSFVMTFITVSLIFVAAESLTRKAFGKHLRLWNNWNPHIANSYTVLGHTIGGYAMIGFDMAFLVTFYYISAHYFNWWVPLSQLVEPNVLATYLPWLSSIAKSLQAGFVEEAQYRAIPLAGAALIGQRFGNRNRWIFCAFILQAIIFGAAHANYAAQPAYARLVELIIPSFIFAGLYLRFGLLTSVVMHYAYDVFWFALPIFISHAPGIWIDRSLVLFFTFLPISVVLYRFAQYGVERLQPDAFNGTWHPAQIESSHVQQAKPIVTKNITAQQKKYMGILTIVSLCALFMCNRFHTDAPALLIHRSDAIAIARNGLEERGIALDTFQGYAQIKGKLEKTKEQELAHHYIWQTYSHDVYTKLLGSYLNPPHWLVKFINFSAPLPARAHMYEVIVGPKKSVGQEKYGIISWKYVLPESAPGERLTKAQARSVAEKVVASDADTGPSTYEVSATPKQLPARTDWTFTFVSSHEDIKEGEARTKITLAGDRVTDYHKEIKLPECWKRSEKKERAAADALQELCNLLIRIFCFAGLCVALFVIHKKRSGIFTFFGICLSVYSIKLINNWPQLIAQFNTAAPFMNQVFQTYGILVIQFLLQALLFAVLLSLTLYIKPRYVYRNIYDYRLIGILTGVIITTAYCIAGYFKPDITPLWGMYNPLGTALPAIGFINAQILKYLQYLAIFTFGNTVLNYLTDSGTKRQFLAVCLCLLAGWSYTGYEGIESLMWIFEGFIFGLSIFVAWRYLLRFSQCTLAYTLATAITLSIVQQMIFNIIPSILITGIISIISLFVVAHIFCEYYEESTCSKAVLK